MTNSNRNYYWFYPILLIPYTAGFFLSFIQIPGLFILKKGIADPALPGFNSIDHLSNYFSNLLSISSDTLYFGIIITVIVLSLIIPLYLVIKNIDRHFSGWLLFLNLLVSAPTLLLLFVGLMTNNS
jgi:ABC-type spermidine/putrescine transport system permease subunit I